MASIGDLAQRKEEFEKNGYTVIENFLTNEEIEALKGEMHQIVDKMDPNEHPKDVFTTYDPDKHIGDDYFLTSSDKIRFFYEEGTFDKQSGELLVEKGKALNKVGHALHHLSEPFKNATFSEKSKKVAKVFGFKNPLVVQSMYIFKPPKIGGSVVGHCDATFLNVIDAPNGLLGYWIALDDADEHNGCLYFIPGSHKEWPNDTVTYTFERTGNTKGELLHFVGKQPNFDEKRYVPLPVKKGSLVLVHGLVWHKSEANTSQDARHVYAVHLAEKQCTWSEKNWLQETDTYKFPELYC